MPIRIHILLVLFLVGLGSTAVLAQGADERTPPLFGRHRGEDMPKNVLETREKMRIEKAKKDFQDMMDRGDEVVKLTDRIERAFGASGRLSDSDLESLEKDVKKIRSDLGGDDDDENVDAVLGEKQPSVADAVTSLKSATATLYGELKKTTRFTISAAAIQSSNAVIKIARFLRLGK